MPTVRITGRVYTSEGWVKPGPRATFVEHDLSAEEAERLVAMFPERITLVSPAEEKRSTFPKRVVDRSIKHALTR